MDDIIEAIVKGIANLLKFLLYIIIFNIILFNIGRASLLLITLGNYPRYRHIEKDSEKIALFGLFLIIAALFTLGVYNNLNT